MDAIAVVVDKHKMTATDSFQKYVESFLVDLQRHHAVHQLPQQNVLLVVVTFDGKLRTKHHSLHRAITG